MRVFDENSLAKRSLTVVTAVEVKQLLTQLSTVSQVCFRYRMIGEMWVTNMMRVSTVSQKTALLYDDVDNKYMQVRINNIMQFEIDQRFQIFQPHFHYNVLPSPELE